MDTEPNHRLLGAGIVVRVAALLRAQIPVAHELIDDWDSVNPVDQSRWPGRLGPPYSEDEVEAMQQFHAEWSWVCDNTPNLLPWDLDVVHGLPEWERLRAAAEVALAVFQRRGKLPEWSGSVASRIGCAPPPGDLGWTRTDRSASSGLSGTLAT